MGPEVSQRFTTRADVIAKAQALLGYLKAGRPKEILKGDPLFSGVVWFGVLALHCS